MFELSLHILDLVQNAISAGARLVIIEIDIDTRADVMAISIRDDGCGMDAALLARVTSPFATTRTTRKVGLGIPMFKQCAEMCGGTFSIESEPGVGTNLRATFQYAHVDRPPVGDMAATMQTLVLGAPDGPEFSFRYRIDGREFTFDTREVRAALGGVSLAEPAVLNWIRDAIAEGIGELTTEQEGPPPPPQ